MANEEGELFGENGFNWDKCDAVDFDTFTEWTFSMLTTTNLAFKMQPIQDVRRTAEAVWITFRDGSVARLNLDHPNFDVLMIYVESNWRRSRPVGVTLDSSGQVLDLGAAHDTPVRSIQEFANDPTRLQVGFWAYSPVCGLTRDQPEFERIHATLAKAVKTGQMVWVVTNALEVVEGEMDEDGLIPAYPKIMDVRLV